MGTFVFRWCLLRPPPPLPVVRWRSVLNFQGIWLVRWWLADWFIQSQQVGHGCYYGGQGWSASSLIDLCRLFGGALCGGWLAQRVLSSLDRVLVALPWWHAAFDCRVIISRWSALGGFILWLAWFGFNAGFHTDERSGNLGKIMHKYPPSRGGGGDAYLAISGVMRKAILLSDGRYQLCRLVAITSRLCDHVACVCDCYRWVHVWRIWRWSGCWINVQTDDAVHAVAV